MKLTKGVCSCNEQGAPWSDDFKDCCSQWCTKCTNYEECTTCKSDMTLRNGICFCLGDLNRRTDVCTPCGPAKYWEPDPVSMNYGTQFPGCFICPEKTYRDPEDVEVCLDCEGRTNQIRTTCTPCLPGEYWDTTTKLCTNCPAKKYRLDTNQNVCLDCEGRVEGNGVNDRTVCTPCLDGEYWNSGTKLCTNCPANTYRLGGSQNTCLPCEGTVGNGRTTCTPCADGQYWNSGTKLCTNCPVNTYRLGGN